MLADGGDAARARRPRSRSSSTRSTTCSTSRRGDAAQDNLRGLRRRVRRAAAPTSTARSQRAPELLRPPRAGDAQPRRPAHRARRVLRASSATPRAIVAPVSDDQRAAVHRRWPTPSRRSRATRRRCKDTIAKTPGDARRRHALARASSARSSSDTAALSRDLDGAHARAARRAADRSTARCEVGTPVTRRSVAALRRPAATRWPRCATLAERADDQRRAARPDGDGHHAAAAAALPRPVRHGLQLPGTSFWTFTAEHFTAPDAPAARERALLNNGDDGPRQRLTSIGRQRVRPRRTSVGAERQPPQYLHGNIYGSARSTTTGRPTARPASRATCYARQPVPRPTPRRPLRATSSSTTPTSGVPDRPPAARPSTRFDKQGKGIGLDPRPRARRPDVHDASPAARADRRTRDATSGAAP